MLLQEGDKKALSNICSKEEGATPLMFAAMNGNVEAVQILINVGCNLDKQDTISGWTALLQATYHGHTEVVLQLLHAGADVNIEAHNGCNAIDIALLIGEIYYTSQYVVHIFLKKY